MDEIWSLEERFWLGGVDAFRRHMHPECTMAFQAPVGILTGAGIVASLKEAPRWASVEMDERHVSRPASDAVVLAYRARAFRDGSPPYGAYCTSVYVRLQDRWQLVQHQQTPA